MLLAITVALFFVNTIVTGLCSWHYARKPTDNGRLDRSVSRLPLWQREQRNDPEVPQPPHSTTTTTTTVIETNTDTEGPAPGWTTATAMSTSTTDQSETASTIGHLESIAEEGEEFD